MTEPASDLQSPSATGPVLVLVVDDEESVRNLVNKVLQRAGYRTVVAVDGPNALRVAAKLEGLGLLVTDMMMPGMNGDELAQHLRATHPHLKVLYLTGFSDRLFRYRPGLWENERLLEKPFNPTDLLTTVSSLVSPPDKYHFDKRLNAADPHLSVTPLRRRAFRSRIFQPARSIPRLKLGA